MIRNIFSKLLFRKSKLIFLFISPENINRILNYMESLMSQDDEVIDKQYILYKLANPFNDYI
jgi:hypothetical protein